METLFPTLVPPRENSLTTEERNALVMTCERLCHSIARRVGSGVPGIDLEDLGQEALVACVEAAKRWHPDQGTKFSTYATPCIERHLTSLTTRVRCEATVHMDSWESVTDPRSLEVAEEGSGETDLALTPEQQVAMDRLPDQSRVAVTLVLQGLAPDRIAERLGIAVKDAKLILRNAEKQLRKDLAWVSLPGLFGVTEEFADAKAA
jgi:RNA polymerase sigma factor (sigma-70 family)